MDRDQFRTILRLSAYFNHGWTKAVRQNAAGDFLCKVGDDYTLMMSFENPLDIIEKAVVAEPNRCLLYGPIDLSTHEPDETTTYMDEDGNILEEWFGSLYRVQFYPFGAYLITLNDWRNGGAVDVEVHPHCSKVKVSFSGVALSWRCFNKAYTLYKDLYDRGYNTDVYNLADAPISSEILYRATREELLEDPVKVLSSSYCQTRGGFGGKVVQGRFGGGRAIDFMDGHAPHIIIEGEYIRAKK